MNSNPPESLPEVGTKILLQDTHPWAGKTGTIVSHHMLLIGKSAKVELDADARITCYVRYQKDWEAV